MAFIEIGSHNTGGRFIKVKLISNVTLEDNIVISVLCEGNIEIGSHNTGGRFIKVKLI